MSIYFYFIANFIQLSLRLEIIWQHTGKKLEATHKCVAIPRLRSTALTYAIDALWYIFKELTPIVVLYAR